MRNSTQNIVVDMIISHHEGSVALKPENRDELIGHLTHVLVNPATLKHYLDFLNRMKVQLSHPTVFRKVLNQAYKKGLGALSDSEIAALSLDARALTHLHKAVDGNQPSAWHKAIREENLKPIQQRKGSKKR